MANVSGSQWALDMGPVPGTHSVTLRVRPQRGAAVWLIRGTENAISNPPTDLQNRADGLFVFPIRSERVTLHGLSEGNYTAIWGQFHVETPGMPRVRHLQVPTSGEVSLLP
jgi:hypothetical protein